MKLFSGRYHRRRLWSMLWIFSGLAVAVALTLLGLKEHLHLFLHPADLKAHSAWYGKTVWIGGEVKHLHRLPQSLAHGFELCDTQACVQFHYHGLLPVLFREHYLAVVKAELAQKQPLTALQVLAKHDETYRPTGLQHGD